jgi:predicted glycoside hydrolase/deacetylase ChbG (UPF0249 family)
MPQRRLIVNADDLGLSEAVNAGVLRAHREGIVTSASMMVRRDAAGDGARVAQECPRLAVGLHLDIAEWVYRDGAWALAYARCEQDSVAAVRSECRSQLEAFRALLGRDPTHIDSHQHAHRSEPVASVARALAEEIGVPLRGGSIRYEGGFYGQSGKGDPYPDGVALPQLVTLIETLPPGWTEIGCHPGLGVTDESSYAYERELEVATLCDPSLPFVLQRQAVQLCSFADYEAVI